MGVKDIVKKTIVEAFDSTDLSLERIILVMAVTAILSLYIFAIYRIITKKTFYSKTFNISLVLLAIITAAIIMTIQKSIVVSLGMVGALSIVRFRTAVKEPLDLVFLFWSIAVGIICGAGIYEVAIVLDIVITIAIFSLDNIPIAKTPQILIINSMDTKAKSRIEEILKQTCKSFKLKSRNFSRNQMDLVYEIYSVKEEECVDEIRNIESIITVSLIAHDGETTY